MDVTRTLRRIAVLGCTSFAFVLATTGCDSSGTPTDTTTKTDGAAASTSTPTPPPGTGGGKGKALPGRGAVGATKKEVQAGGANVPNNKMVD